LEFFSLKITVPLISFLPLLMVSVFNEVIFDA
jgi:hypothetical protein